jgi:hypothetical protein
MLIEARDLTVLMDSPLLWRWTQETHAKLLPDELASIRPIRPEKAASIFRQAARVPAPLIRPGDRLLVEEDSDFLAVGKWLDDKVPRDESDILVVWDQNTAAVVPRRLLIDRWDDFWYPCSDDLTVLGTTGEWRLQMCHYGIFDFFESGAG